MSRSVLAIDPGAKPGFAWDFGDTNLGHCGVSAHPEAVEADAEFLTDGQWDEVVVEDQHLANFMYRNGRRVRISKKSQLTLVRTAERLLMRFPAVRQYRIAPDAWRALIWPGSRRLPKKTVLARLKAAEPALLCDATDDAVEARGIIRGWLTLTQKQKEVFRVR